MNYTADFWFCKDDGHPRHICKEFDGFAPLLDFLISNEKNILDVKIQKWSIFNTERI